AQLQEPQERELLGVVARVVPVDLRPAWIQQPSLSRAREVARPRPAPRRVVAAVVVMAAVMEEAAVAVVMAAAEPVVVPELAHQLQSRRSPDFHLSDRPRTGISWSHGIRSLRRKPGE